MTLIKLSYSSDDSIKSCTNYFVSNEIKRIKSKEEILHNSFVESILNKKDDYATPVRNEYNIPKLNETKPLTTKKTDLKSLIRSFSKSFSKQCLYKNRRNPLLPDPSVKMFQSKNVNNKISNYRKTLTRVFSRGLNLKGILRLDVRIPLPHNADTETVRKKYRLSKWPKLQNTFQYGFNINNYKSISITTFEKYVETMKFFYTTYTYKICLMKNTSNMYQIFFKFHNDMDTKNVSEGIINLTYLNTITGECNQKYHSIKRDQTSFNVIKPKNNIILFEIFHEGMNENEHLGKGFKIF